MIFSKIGAGITISYADTEICGLDFSREDDCRAAGFLKSPAVVLKQLHYDSGNRPIITHMII